mgnify:CR=1 FL=1
MKKKVIIGIIILLIIVGIIIYKNFNNQAEYLIGIGQYGQHSSLDTCREGFIEGLKQEGIVEGENLKIDYQNANFDGGTTNLIASNFATENVDLAMGVGTPMVQALYNSLSEKDIPTIYTAVTYPEEAGLTNGNITGTSDRFLVDEQLQLIKQVLPNTSKIGVIYTTSEVNSTKTVEDLKEAAANYDVEIVDKGITNAFEIQLAVDSIINDVDCFLCIIDNNVVSGLSLMIEKTNEKGIPVFGSEIEQMKLGCICGKGIDYYELGIKTGKMAAKILKGEEKASEMEYEVVEEGTLYINSEALEKVNIELPEEIINNAIDVIE